MSGARRHLSVVAAMRIGSLFSGYGGLDMGVQSVLGGEVVWHVEYDKAPSKILAHHWPDVPNFGDVTTLDFTKVEPVDILTGGYPCQPFSHAGNRKGTKDDRHLWPHVLRAIREMGPSLAILENVRGHLSLGFDVVLADLASVGWSARWGIVRASDAGACHQRARLFIIAYPSGRQLPWAAKRNNGLRLTSERGSSTLAHAGSEPVWQHAGEPSSQEAWSHQGDGTKHRRRVRTTADASSERHGRGQDAGMVGRLGATPEVIGRQASAARSQSGDRGSAATSDATGDRRPPRWTGSGERAREAGQPASDLSTVADADVTGGKTWRHSRHDSERVRVQPLGPAQPLAYADLAGSQGRQPAGGRDMPAWGDYGPAITRWEHVIGRPAPAPTEPGRTGQPRLSPAFVEWMMGLPAGWVTDPAIGISRNDQLRALGNGVVPRQAALALSLLIPPTREAAA
jgi:DNA (cytosine-5)-methyltransferase 1